MKDVIAEIKNFTPKDGCNLVAIDDYAEPGKKLRLIGHFKTRAEAESTMTELKKTPGVGDLAIYAPVNLSLLDK